MAEAVRRAIPTAVTKSGKCEVRFEGSQPKEVADKAREFLDSLRNLEKSSKGFN